MLQRYSGISSSASGVPCASSRTAVCSLMAVHCRVFTDEFHCLLNIFDWSIRDDAVAEVEDVSGAPPGLIEDLVDSPADQLRRSEEGDRVQVTLYRAGVVEASPCPVKRGAPVETEHVGSSVVHRGEQARGVDAEVDHWDAHGLDIADQRLRR